MYAQIKETRLIRNAGLSDDNACNFRSRSECVYFFGLWLTILRVARVARYETNCHMKACKRSMSRVVLNYGYILELEKALSPEGFHDGCHMNLCNILQLITNASNRYASIWADWHIRWAQHNETTLTILCIWTTVSILNLSMLHICVFNVLLTILAIWTAFTCPYTQHNT